MSEATGVKAYEWRVQAPIAGVINALINAAFGWFMLAAGATMPLWGLPSVAFDLFAMSFGISFGTALFITPMLRAEQQRGRLCAPDIAQRHRDSFAKWPASTLQRAINLGLLSALVFAPLPLLGLWLLAPEGFEREALTAWKAGFGFVQGAIVTPIIALAALTTR